MRKVETQSEADFQIVLNLDEMKRSTPGTNSMFIFSYKMYAPEMVNAIITLRIHNFMTYDFFIKTTLGRRRLV